MDEFTTHSGGGQLAQRFSFVALGRTHGDLLDFVDGHARRPPQALNDRLCAHALLDQLFDLLEYLSGKHHNRGRAVADFRVLRPRNVRQDPRRRVDDVQQFHDRGSIVGDGLSTVGVDKE